MLDEDTKEARKMITRLSELLRMLLENAHSPEVSLQQEMQIIERYLQIEQIRFQDRLNVTLDIAPETRQAIVPSLILQPLVENAIKHGIAPHSWAGNLHIQSRIIEGKLQLLVQDDGEGIKLTETTIKAQE